MARTSIALAAGLAAALAASAAAAQDAEMACIEALSRELGVPMGVVDVRGSRDSPGRGTAVHARVDNAPYTCWVDDAGRVTGIERGNA